MAIRNFSEKDEAARLIKVIVDETKYLKKPVNIMEICGTHTMDISRYGLRKLLPPEVNLISGPGCPICVTPIEDIDRAIEIAAMDNNITATFGDMMKVPGTKSTLGGQKSRGLDIRVLYSPEAALDIAGENPDKNVIFIGVGFETTSPAVAITLKEAKQRRLKNFFVLPAFKTVIPAMEALLIDPELKLDGFMAPGHVSAIIGAKPYESLVEKYGKPCVITGFESLDILQGIKLLVRQHATGSSKVEVQYKRIVKYEGNKIAKTVMSEIFSEADTNWRGIGVIPKSGLTLSGPYSDFNALLRFKTDISYSREPAGCRCGEVLKGIIKPAKCGLFAKKCTPEHPVGACMVSTEGTCAAYYKYER